MKKNLVMMATVFLLSLSLSYAGEVVIIINAKSPWNTQMSASLLKDIYAGKIKFEGKVKLLPSDQKDKDIFEAFLKDHLNTTPSNYKTTWVKKVFSEGGAAPKQLDSSKDVIRYVAGHQGAIGYIWDDELSGAEGVAQAKISK